MELQARAGAMDELFASGAIEDPTRSYGDDITRELDSLANDHAIDAELSALKAQLGTGRDGSAPELESGAENGTDPHTGSRSVRRQEDQS
jgi:phage shock protein A